MNNRRNLLWQMTAEQFAAFDVQLYLDTHPNDRHAMGLFNKYQENHQKLKREYEALAGAITSDTATDESWRWVDNPWPWEREAN